MQCFELDGVSRFGDRAAIYAAGRPSYPAAAIDAILSREITTPIVDVGTGTGISARLLADRGATVIGIDPGSEMLRMGVSHRGVLRTEGRAEQLPLRSRSTELITAFNSFHWFKAEPFFAEVRRVSRPGGRIALVWNDWDGRDEFTAAFVKLMRSAAGDYPVENRWNEVAPLFSTTTVEKNIERHEFPYSHRLDRHTLPLRLQSMSYIPREGPLWDKLASELEELFEKYATKGHVEHQYLTHVFIAAIRH